MLKLNKTEWLDILGYLHDNFQKNRMTILKMLAYGQAKGWYKEVNDFLNIPDYSSLVKKWAAERIKKPIGPKDKFDLEQIMKDLDNLNGTT